MEKIEILGIRLDNLSLQEVLTKVEHFLRSSHQHFIVTPNPEFLVAAQKDQKFKNILNYADIATSDGVGLLYAAKFLKQRLIRVTGIDLVWSITELAAQNQHNWPVYFLGAGEGVAQTAAEILKKEFTNLSIAGSQSGGTITLAGAGDQRIINDINASGAKILFVAFGQIKQEKWIFKNLDQMPTVRLAIGVGGAFDYIAGIVPRAPMIVRRLGLEWLYRLIKQPERWQRIFNAVIIFSFLIIKNRLLGNPSRDLQEAKVRDEIKDQN